VTLVPEDKTKGGEFIEPMPEWVYIPYSKIFNLSQLRVANQGTVDLIYSAAIPQGFIDEKNQL
jgi:hypothetical protein